MDTYDVVMSCLHLTPLPTFISSARSTTTTALRTTPTPTATATTTHPIHPNSLPPPPPPQFHPQGSGYHLAVGSERGRLLILDAVTLQPLLTHKRGDGALRDMCYTPPGSPEHYLAVASADLCVDIYDVDKGYQFVSRCVGHSASVEFVDWSLPVQEKEPAKYYQRRVLGGWVYDNNNSRT